MAFVSKTITQDDADIRLDRFFKRHKPNIPFGNIAKLVRTKKITVNGKRAEISQRLNEGDVVKHPQLEAPLDNPLPYTASAAPSMVERIKKAVIFEDKNIIALNKPAGLAVQGGSGVRHSVDDMCVYLQSTELGKPKLVHRIDKNTSGILILARNAKVASMLSEIIKSRQIRKTYIALCQGAPKQFEGVIDTPLPSHHNQVDDGKPIKMRKAVTHYHVVDKAHAEYSLLELEILTGRNHQIRIHLASLNCYILGDKKYGTYSEIQRNIPNRMYLHAHTLRFELLGTKYELLAPLPPQFNEALNLLELSASNMKYSKF
jgi:23S rRNA pseudouridine955/2504/2580 synthase